MSLSLRLARFEAARAPRPRPATLADLVCCARGELDPARLDLAVWEPLAAQLRKERSAHA